MVTELIIDNFAGGGGASTGIEAATGRSVDIAINHDPVAIAMHHVNHPLTKYLCESVWTVNPVEVCAGRPVGLAWFSPDCTHFSKAKGGKPVKKKIRGLAWVVLRWATSVRPRIIMLENVEEFITWGPLVKKEDGTHYPCPKRKGRTFNVFINALKKQGYNVEWRSLRACDYGAPTIRKRLFLIARCDGQLITWPEPTHGDPKLEAVKAGRLKPWRVAAECIDWSIPCPSIFERKKPLAEATLRRITKGVKKYIIDAAEPFIVPSLTHQEQEAVSSEVKKSMNTMVVANLVRNMEQSVGSDLNEPCRTVTMKEKGSLITSHIIKLKGTNIGHDILEPLHTITAGGMHFGEVRAFLTKIERGRNAVMSKGHFGVVTVYGEEYQIADIGMRMLAPRELFRAQGFLDTYIIDRDINGKSITKTEQVAKCGNSVCPDMATALVRANVVVVKRFQWAYQKSIQRNVRL